MGTRRSCPISWGWSDRANHGCNHLWPAVSFLFVVLVALAVVAIAAGNALAEEDIFGLPLDKSEKNPDALPKGAISRLENIANLGVFGGFSPDNKYFATADTLYDVTSGKLLSNLSGNSSFVFLEDGTPLSVTHADNVVKVVDIRQSSTILTIKASRVLLSAATRPGTRGAPLLLVAAEGSLERAVLWDLTARKSVLEISEPDLVSDLGSSDSADYLIASPNGKRLAWLSRTGEVHVWDIETKAHERLEMSLPASKRNPTVKRHDPILFFSASSERLACYSHELSNRNNDSTVSFRVWALFPGKRLARVDELLGELVSRSGPTAPSVGFTSDEREIVLVAFLRADTQRGKSLVSRFRRWSAETGTELTPLLLDGPAVQRDLGALSIVERTHLFAGGGQRRFWRLASAGQHRQHDLRNVMENRRTYFSPDARLVGLTADSEARLYETTSREIVLTLSNCEFDFYYPATYSRDGTRILCLERKAPSKVLARSGLVWNLAGAAARPESWGVESCWRKLGGSAIEARQAMIEGVALRSQMVTFLRETLEPVGRDAERIARFVVDLDDDDFEKREAAKIALIAAGVAARPAVERALRETKSLEVQARAREILSAIAARATDSETLRRLRAIEILERIGTSDAKDVLRRVAKGNPDLSEVTLAQQALRNLDTK